MYSSTFKKKGLIAIVIVIFLAVLNGNSMPVGALGGRRRLQAGDRIQPSLGKVIPDTKLPGRESVGDSLLESFTGGDKVTGSDKVTGGDKVNKFPLAGRLGFLRKKTSGQAEEQIPDHNPATATDNKGNMYLVWEHGNELWWAANRGGNWTGSGKMPGKGGNRPVIIYISGISDQIVSAGQAGQAVQAVQVVQAVRAVRAIRVSQAAKTGQIGQTGQETPADQGASLSDAVQGTDQPACGWLFCSWESLDSPKKIMGSTGTLTDSGVTWSEPQALTVDDHDDYGISLVMDNNHHPLMLWLQQASFDDDSDLYYQVITSTDSSTNSPADSSTNSPSDSPANSSANSSTASSVDSSVDVIQVTASASTIGNQAALSAPTNADQVTGGSASGNGDQAAESALCSGGQAAESDAGSEGQTSGEGQETSPVNEDRGASPIPSDGDPPTPPPSNWVGQAPSPLSITGPFPPYVTSSCVETDPVNTTITLRSSIPMLGDTVNLAVAHFRCFHSPALQPVGTPAVINDVITVLTLGPHLSVGVDLYQVGQVALNTASSGNTSGGGSSAIQQMIFEYGGSLPFVYLSNPIPLSACGQQIGTTRIGLTGGVGIAYAFIRRPNSLELPREFEISTGVALGVQQNVNSLGSKFQGYINASGGYTVNYSVPQSPVRPSLSRGPFFVISAAGRVGGDWAGLVYRFAKVYTPADLGKLSDPNAAPYNRMGPWRDPNVIPYYQKLGQWIDPNYLQGIRALNSLSSSQEKGDPNSSQETSIAQSMKDKITKTMTSIMNDGKTLLNETLDMGKMPLTGTGAVYEGTPVLGDISGDIYNDGIPSMARSESGEIMVVWAKAFAASALGTKIYAATYNNPNNPNTAGGWNSPVEITPEIAFQEGPSVVFDSHGNPMAVWSSASNAGLDYEHSSVEQILQAIENEDLMYSQRREGKWTAPKPLAILPGLDERVNLAAGPNGEITAVWINQSDKGSLIYGSLWNGIQWTVPNVIAQTALAESPVAVYTAQKPSVIWAQDEDGQTDTFNDWGLYTSSWDGTSWHSQPLSVGGKSTGEKSTDNKKNRIINSRVLNKITNLPALPALPAIKSGRIGRRRINNQ